MTETDPSSVHQDPTTELVGRFSETACALFSAGGVIDTLQRVVDLATETIEGCDFAGVFLLGDDSITTPAHTDPLVVEIDTIQHQCEEGPCLAAMAQRTTHYADDLADDARWPCFGPRATALGVRSALAVSLSATAGSGRSTCTPDVPRPSGSSTGPKG